MNNIINISDFNEIVKGIKVMKADLIYVKGPILYGTDNNFFTLKMYNMNTSIPLPPFTIITKSLSSEFYNSIIDTSINIDFDSGKMYCIDSKSAMITTECNYRIESIINNLYNDLYNKIHRDTTKQMYKIVDIGDITNDEYFERFRSIKSGDGAELYTPFGDYTYGMYLYNGAIPMVKADKVGLEIFDLGETFIAAFTVFKKKNQSVTIYFRFVKLENSMCRV